MGGPENFKEIIVLQDQGIVIDGNHLSMFPQIIIAGVCFVATGITDACAENTLQTSELGVGPPKSAKAKSRRFKFNPSCLCIEGKR